MFIPKPSPLDSNVVFTESSEKRTRLFRRKGGGGHGSSGHSSGSKGGSSGSRSGSSGSSAAKAHGASDTFTKSRGGSTINLSSTKSSASAYSDGGGKRITLGSDSPFSGRQAGGGARNTIYGTSHFGSGYPYGGYGSFVSSRPLPYLFYPVPVSYNYYGGDEYLNVNSSERPGGNLVTALVQPSFNTSSVTYRLVGDNASVITVFDALVANCSVVNSSSAITTFTPSNLTWPLPEQVVQYYRASSFALSLDGYNNTASLLANAPASNDSSPVQMADTALPSGLNLTFLECVNTTTGASVPLVDVSSRKKLSGQDIAGIVIGGIIGLVIFVVFLCWCCGGPHDNWEDRKEKKQKQKQKSGLRVAPAIHISKPAEVKPPSYFQPSSYQGMFIAGSESKSRPTSADERTLAAEPVSDKNRWSFVSSSSASSRTDVNDSIEGHKATKLNEQPRLPESTNDSSSWLTKIPFVGHRFDYRSVKHLSTSSIELPLAGSHNLHNLESSSEHADTLSPSPSPSPSPYNPTFPLIHTKNERPPR